MDLGGGAGSGYGQSPEMTPSVEPFLELPCLPAAWPHLVLGGDVLQGARRAQQASEDRASDLLGHHLLLGPDPRAPRPPGQEAPGLAQAPSPGPEHRFSEEEG